MKQEKKRVKWRVVIYSLIALGFVALSFFIDWLFLIPAVVLMWLNQKQLMKKS